MKSEHIRKAFERFIGEHPSVWKALLREDQSYVLSEYRPDIADWTQTDDEHLMNYFLNHNDDGIPL